MGGCGWVGGWVWVPAMPAGVAASAIDASVRAGTCKDAPHLVQHAEMDVRCAARLNGQTCARALARCGNQAERVWCTLPGPAEWQRDCVTTGVRLSCSLKGHMQALRPKSPTCMEGQASALAAAWGAVPECRDRGTRTQPARAVMIQWSVGALDTCMQTSISVISASAEKPKCV